MDTVFFPPSMGLAADFGEAEPAVKGKDGRFSGSTLISAASVPTPARTRKVQHLTVQARGQPAAAVRLRHRNAVDV